MMDKSKTFWVMVAMMIFLFSCSSPPKNTETKTIDINTIDIIHKEFSHFTDIGKISKVVQLETSENSLVGTINRVIIDENSEDILVGDYYSSKKVLRFNKDGKYITSYGTIGEGPAEYKQLDAFDSDSNGDIILLTTSKLMKFSKEGNFLLERRTDYFANSIEIIDKSIFVSVLSYRRSTGEKKAIQVLNSYFVNTGSFGEFDLRLEKYCFTTSDYFAKRGANLYFLENYDLKLNIYNTKNSELSPLSIPNQNSQLDLTWGKKEFTENDRREIKKNIHRFSSIYAFKEGLFLLETCREKNIYNCWILNLDKKKAVVFPYRCLIGNSETKKSHLFIDWIAGSFPDGIIGVFGDSDSFNRHKSRYPMLKDLEFGTEDNPRLVFIRFDNSIW